MTYVSSSFAAARPTLDANDVMAWRFDQAAGVSEPNVGNGGACVLDPIGTPARQVPQIIGPAGGSFDTSIFSSARPCPVAWPAKPWSVTIAFSGETGTGGDWRYLFLKKWASDDTWADPFGSPSIGIKNGNWTAWVYVAARINIGEDGGLCHPPCAIGVNHVVTLSATNALISLYADGALIDSNAYGGGAILTGAGEVSFGGRHRNQATEPGLCFFLDARIANVERTLAYNAAFYRSINPMLYV